MTPHFLHYFFLYRRSIVLFINRQSRDDKFGSRKFRNTTRGRKSHPSIKLQVSSSHRSMKRPASEVLYAYTLLQQPLAIMDVMQVCNLRLLFLSRRKPLLWFMIFQGKKVVSRGFGSLQGWSDAFGGRVKFEGVVVWETKTSFVCFSCV